MTLESKNHRSLLSCFFLYLLIFQHFVLAEVGKFTSLEFPEALNNTTVKLPDNIVAMGENVLVGNPSNIFNMSGKSSIVFVIDHSASMRSNLSEPGNDQWGSRFTVTRALIDTIYNKNPKSRVGLVVFATNLWFDPNDDPLFKPFNGPGYMGGYIPLLALDSTYANNMTGYQILNKYLIVDTIHDPLWGTFVSLKYKSSNSSLKEGETCINAGFDAAKDAMKLSPFAKERNFVIFFSDGDANRPDQATQYDYVKGTDVPTTFTVYFTMDGTPAFANLKKMTDNIKNNGYSKSNPQSNLWTIKTDFNTLMKLLINNVITQIFTSIYTYTPKALMVNNITPISPWNGSYFKFKKLFPLTGVTTEFKYDITYKVNKDSILVNGDTSHIPMPDTSINSKLTAVLEKSALPPPKTVLCHWDRTLEFFYNGNKITSANETMKELELRFKSVPVDTLYGYDSIVVTLVSTAGTTKDKETYLLVKNGDYFTVKFSQSQGTAQLGDGILQHQIPDICIATYRNPDLPLDTLQATLSFGGLKMTNAIYFDNNADGHVDSLFLGYSEKDIGLVADALVKAAILPPARKFTTIGYTAVDYGIGLRVKEEVEPIKTYVTSDDYVEVKDVIILPNGDQLLPGKTMIIDSVAPVIHWEPKSAFLKDYKIASKQDTLGVKFSEPVKIITSDEPFYFLSHINNTNYVVKLLAAGQPKPDSLVFQVVSATGAAAMLDGDSLWIHETNRIADTVGNFQNNGLNIKRRLYVDLLYGPITIECGYYYDNNADGYVDSIFVKATTEIDGGLTDARVQEIVQKAITLPGFRGFTVNGSGVVAGGFYIKVTENKSHTPFTYITNDDKLIVSTYTLSMGGNISGGTLPMYDRIAPLIHWETKAVILIDYMDLSTADTLFIKFSEPVTRVTATEPFYFLDKGKNTNYIVNLKDVNQPEAGRMVFYITSVTGVDYMEDGDSVWIHEMNRVSDEAGNFQNNLQNTKRKLYVRRISLPYKYVPQAVSPVSYNSLLLSNRVPSEIVTVLGNDGILPGLNLQKNQNGDYCGMILMVVPQPENIGQYIPDLKMRGTLTILDAVGNTIVLDEKLAWWDERKNLVWVWNLKNRNGRVVGPGMYVCLFEIEDITESLGEQRQIKQMKKITIGVK